MTTSILLIVGAFALLAIGILVGRYYVPDDRALRRTAGHAEAYMRALEHLLRRDDDAAIAELRAVVSDNVTALEPYFALASLFRSRGEWERAIRVHQAIELRKDTKKSDRLRARYELGLDFRSAGMPRRATRAMEECLEGQPDHLGALRALCGLYEEQRRYNDAAQIWRRLRKVTGEEADREAHLWAAAAQRAAGSEDLDEAKNAIKAARKLAPESPHVLAAAADVEAARENSAAQAENLRAALVHAPDWAVYLVPQLLDAELGRAGVSASGTADEARYVAAAEATVRELESLVFEIGNNATVMLAIAELRSHFNAEAALHDFRTIADMFPDLLPARVASARLALSGGDATDIRNELIALVGPKGALAWATEGAWRCGHCSSRERGILLALHQLQAMGPGRSRCRSSGRVGWQGPRAPRNTAQIRGRVAGSNAGFGSVGERRKARNPREFRAFRPAWWARKRLASEHPSIARSKSALGFALASRLPLLSDRRWRPTNPTNPCPPRSHWIRAKGAAEPQPLSVPVVGDVERASCGAFSDSAFLSFTSLGTCCCRSCLRC